MIHYSDDSVLGLPTYKCQQCIMYVTGVGITDNDTIKQTLDKLYAGQYWNERNSELSISSNYTDVDSQGKNRNFTSQYKYCLPHIKDKKSILEIGTGSGQTTFWLDELGYVVTGIEPDARNVNMINQKLKRSKVKTCYVEDLQIEEKFEIIWMSHVLEHLLKPDVFLKSILRNLRDDGVFFIEVPNVEHDLTLKASIEENPHIFHFSKKSLTNILTNSGYDVICCDFFRPATKAEGAKNKISSKSYPYYPRILTDNHHGRDLRVIVKRSH